MPRRCRPFCVIGLAVAAIAALALLPASAPAQTPLPDPGVDLLQPSPLGNPAKLPRFRPNGTVAPQQDQTPPPGAFAPSRIGATPVYGSPPAFGAGGTGFDSTNTGRRQKRRSTAQTDPDAAQPQSTFAPVPGPPARPAKPAAPPPPGPEIYPLNAANRPGAAIKGPPETLPVSNPPAEVYPHAAADRPGAVLPIPPADVFQPSAEPPPPGVPPPNTLPLGTQPHRLLPIAAGDPYAALGLRTGSFLLFPAIELSGGYDNNAPRVPSGQGSWDYVVAPELQVQSDWSRHSLTADIRGTYTEYANNNITPSLSRPYLNATIDGRIDVRRGTQILLENRYLVSTDNPGSPNLQAGLAKLPVFTTVGGTLGVVQDFNRFQVTVKGTFDRSTYNNSILTDGEVVSNADRNFNQYGGIARFGYDLGPALKPFVEFDADRRIYDELFDSAGLRRDSTGTSVKVGSDLNLFGTLSGELAAGYLQRVYQDPTLPQIGGIIADGSLLWQATALTSAKLTATSTVTESVLPGTSGEFSRDINVQVDHAFLGWLVGTMLVGYGHDDYIGFDRLDDRYFVSVGFIYKLSRELQIKGTVREDWLNSTASGAAYDATSFLLGVRLQR